MGLFSKLREKFARKSVSESVDTTKYVEGLAKSREHFASKFKWLSKKYKAVNEEYFEELEETLISADVGVEFALETMEEILKESKSKHLKEPEQINELLMEKLLSKYEESGKSSTSINFVDGTTVLIVSGVNGVGKTTTIAKLANKYKNEGKKVMLVAADTFRAGATEQLEVWASRLNVDIVVGKENQDPASVVYDGVVKAKKENVDLLIVDTAGRLQNKNNLMAELSKIYRVLAKEIPNAPHESLLVIDATVGQNGLVQAQTFKEVAKITGIVITKMDGTSKGGIVLSIKEKLGIPVKFIGLGEGINDLMEFDLEKYIYGLCAGEDDE